MLSRPFHRLRAFLHLPSTTYFSALFAGNTFSRSFHRLDVIPRALTACCIFSRAFHRLHAFPHFSSTTCFSAPFAGYMFSRAFASCSDWLISLFALLTMREAAVTSCCLIFTRYRHGTADSSIYLHSYVVPRPLQS